MFASAAQGMVPPALPAVHPLRLLQHSLPVEVAEHVGTYLESARLLGCRTAELHLALSSGEAGSEFSREPMTPHYLRGVFQSMPPSSIPTPRRSLNEAGEEIEVRTTGRHDPCVAIRAAPVVEAMTACVLADAFLRHRAQTGGGAFVPGQAGRR